VTLPPEGQQAYNIYSWVNQIFSGCRADRLDGVDCQPVVDREASTPVHLVVSSLPPGDLDGSTLLSTMRKTAKGLWDAQ
jgi:hypothetical protein